jgi:hypothetical protein
MRVLEVQWSHAVRATLHLEAWPVCCVRGFKSSLVIGQKVEIGPNPFTPRGQADGGMKILMKNVWCEMVRAH